MTTCGSLERVLPCRALPGRLISRLSTATSVLTTHSHGLFSLFPPTVSSETEPLQAGSLVQAKQKASHGQCCLNLNHRNTLAECLVRAQHLTCTCSFRLNQRPGMWAWGSLVWRRKLSTERVRKCPRSHSHGKANQDGPTGLNILFLVLMLIYLYCKAKGRERERVYPLFYSLNACKS